MNCPSCNTPLQPEASFCSKCGTQVKLECLKCKAPLAIGEAFCSNCGTPVAVHQKSRRVYITLALLTPFGIHNFYAVRFEKALINLFLDILMIVFGFFAADAAGKSIVAPEYERIQYNNRCDFLVLLILICAIISVVWRIAECCIVTHDVKGVKMK